MPMRPAIETSIPPAIREELQKKITEAGFGSYSEITEWLNEKLEKEGLELRVGRSAVHNFGKNIEANFDSIRRSTQASMVFAREMKDSGAAISDLALRVIQDKVFNYIIANEITVDEIVMVEGKPVVQKAPLSPESAARLGQMLASATKASLSQKKVMEEVEARAAKVADEVAADMKESGLSDEKAALIRAKIFGITTA